MSLEQFVTDYGPLGLFVGASVEGEAVAMLGGVLSHRHLMEIWVAIPAVASGAFVADQVVFLLGRMCRNHPRIVALRRGPAGTKVMRIFERRPDIFVFSFRFLYGLRLASALTIGTTGYPWARFAILNAAAALVWSVLFVGLGYLCGHAIEAVFGRLHAPSHFLLAGSAVLVIIAALAHVRRKRV